LEEDGLLVGAVGAGLIRARELYRAESNKDNNVSQQVLKE
jgi:hypothetical protein